MKDKRLCTRITKRRRARIEIDQEDRRSICRTLTMCIDPLDDASNPDGALMNIVTGEVAHPDVTADDALSIGQSQMAVFKSGWPVSFYDKLSKVLDSQKKHIQVGKEKVYDQELIYARVIGLLVSSRDINFDDVLSCELAAYPQSMFSPDGQMKVSKSKSTLKRNVQATVSERNCPAADTVIYDVSALLWVIGWPSDRVKLHVYVAAFQTFVCTALQVGNVTLVFDRYYDCSIKTSTRMQRAGSSRVHNLTPDMPTPSKQVIMSVTKNKVPLNTMLADSLLDPDFYKNATQHDHCRCH